MASTRAQLAAKIAADLANNTTGAITPTLLRGVLTDVVAAAPNIEDEEGTVYETPSGAQAKANAAAASTPVAHASDHENGGGDEISVAGLSGVLADPQPPIIGTGADEAVAGNDSRLTDERVPTAAGLTTKFGTNKATIADGDKFTLLDSAAADAPKHGLWSLVKSTLKTYFDTLYQAAGSYLTSGGSLGTPSGGDLSNCTFPTLNQNTSGTAADLSATLAVAKGGTGSTTVLAAQQVLNPLTLNTDATTGYTLVLTDVGKLVSMNNASANVLTIPLNSSVPFEVGTTILCQQLGAGLTTITPTGGVTMNSRGGATNSAGQFAVWTLIKTGTDEWNLTGDIST